jgi:hypothetical protein
MTTEREGKTATAAGREVSRIGLPDRFDVGPRPEWKVSAINHPLHAGDPTSIHLSVLPPPPEVQQ